MNCRKLLTELKRNGWEFYREAKGAHQIYFHPETGAKLITSGLNSRKDLTPNSARRLLSQIRNPQLVLNQYSRHYPLSTSAH